jgi:hypothetical protein
MLSCLTAFVRLPAPEKISKKYLPVEQGKTLSSCCRRGFKGLLEVLASREKPLPKSPLAN